MAIRSDNQTTDRPADERAIHKLFEGLLEDWAGGDGVSYGSRFTEDADYVAFDGTHTRGSASISASHQELFDRWLKGSRLTGRILSVRFLGPDVALVHAAGGTIMRGKAGPAPGRDSVQTLVAVRGDAGWRFAAFHNCRIRPIGGGFRAFFAWALADMSWRVLGPKGGVSRG